MRRQGRSCVIRLSALAATSLHESSCALYDAELLQHDEARSAAGAGPAMRAESGSTIGYDTAREPASPAAGWNAASGDSRAQSSVTPSAPFSRSNATPRHENVDAGTAISIEEADAGPSQDAEVALPTPPLQESPVCGGRLGYVSPVNGHCYFTFEEPVTWHVSRDSCSQARSHLAAITSEQEQAFVASIPLSEPAWIGLSRFGAPNFSWITSETFSFSCWEPGAPRPAPESAAVITPEMGLWADAHPTQLHLPLCEAEPLDSD